MKETVACPSPGVAVTAVGAPGIATFGVTDVEGSDGEPEPFALAAVTVNLYDLPPVRPVTVIGLELLPACVAVMLSGSEVTVYDVIGLPPFPGTPPAATGAAKETVACPFPLTAFTLVGLPGTVEGVTLLEAFDAGPVPTSFAAVTVNAYAVPFVSPVTVIGLAAPVPVMPPGYDVAVYPVIAVPPSDSGGVKKTNALPPAGSALVHALIPVGAPGLVAAGVTETEDDAPAPITLFALRLNVYSMFLRPVTIIGLDDLVIVMLLAGLTKVNVYDVTGMPPLDAGALKAIVA